MIKSLLFLHLFFAIVWVGGMVYSLLFLRPSLREIAQEEQRGKFLKQVFSKFFLAVWLSIIVLFLTGMSLWHGYRKDFSDNSLFHIKLFLFGLMVIIFTYIYFFLFRRNKLSHIPNLIGVNLLLSILILLIIIYIR
uniref:Copper resistance protein D domain-containing protein n=1 Tax=Hydrogenobacter sp. TaxID=2152829 RepID=A0A7C2ZI48_9AQUI